MDENHLIHNGKNKYKNLLEMTWQQSKKSFWRYWIFSLTVIIVAYLILLFLQVDIKEIVTELEKSNPALKEDKTAQSYWEGTLHIFNNNWIVCLQILLFSFIPIPFLNTLSLILSTATLGVVLYASQQVEMNIFKTVILGLLPHSILEISVFILATFYGEKMNKQIREKIKSKLFRIEKKGSSLRKQLKETMTVFILVVTPFIFIAAIIEGYITRFLLN